MNKTLIVIKRILGLPFFMGLMIVSFLWSFFLKSFLWLRYGGEAVNYSEKMNRKTISDVFLTLQKTETK